MNKYTTYLLLGLFALIAYMSFSVMSYSPEEIIISSPNYTPERVLEEDIPEVPELSAEESAEIQEVIKLEEQTVVQELDIKKKSVEQMRDDVQDILDEIVQEDSTVVISFKLEHEVK